jgi:hypothetical protein
VATTERLANNQAPLGHSKEDNEDGNITVVFATLKRHPKVTCFNTEEATDIESV